MSERRRSTKITQLGGSSVILVHQERLNRCLVSLSRTCEADANCHVGHGGSTNRADKVTTNRRLLMSTPVYRIASVMKAEHATIGTLTAVPTQMESRSIVHATPKGSTSSGYRPRGKVIFTAPRDTSGKHNISYQHNSSGRGRPRV